MTILLRLVLFLTFVEFCGLYAQVCRISVAGLNRDRKVFGPVNAECPISIHTPPFGNWGVTSNFGQKGDSQQFEGWCRDTRVCYNDGQCEVRCRDGRYEWNSCTDDSRYRPPNATLYNAANGTQQVTATGINVHGTRIVDVPVSCPVDANADGLAESGGCRDVRTYSSGVNFMSLYELDPGTSDELVQTLYFPEVVITPGCGPWGCSPIASGWVAPNGYDSPASPAKAYAEMAMLINSGVFLDTARGCAVRTFRAETVSAASFARGPVARESIASVFGGGLATSTAAASSLPLPTRLGGSTVAVIDATGVSRPAAMFYASPSQINLLIPTGTPPGDARAVITREDGIVAESPLRITTAAPGVFTANTTGTGVPAAVAVRVSASGAQTPVPVFSCGSAPGSCVAVPLSLGAETDQLIVSLFGTGIRFGATEVRAQVGGQNAEVLFAGAQGQFFGLDQVNVRIPRTLRSRGSVSVLLTVTGVAANAVTLNIQ
jgi:uncharacterized protein (TIGR03437 family)